MIAGSAIDLAVGALALLVAVWFLVAWRRIGEPPFLLFAVGLALKGVGYALGDPAEFAIAHRAATPLESVRLACLFAGNLVMVAAYLGGQGHARRAWLVGGWGVAAAALVLAALDLLVPPLGEVDLATLSPALHGLAALANVACAVLASQGFRASPRPTRALVPAAFLLWGLSNYTWLLIDLGAPSSFGAWVQAWRFLAVLFMLAALIVPGRSPEVTRPAEA